MPSNICVCRVLSCVLGPVDKTVWGRTYTQDHCNDGWDPCSWLWACWSLGLLRAGEGLGCRWGMLFKTKKEMLAQNGEERKQLPVSAVWEEELLWPLGQWATWSILESWLHPTAELSPVECQSPFYLSLGNSSNGLVVSKMNVSAWAFSNMCHGGRHSLGLSFYLTAGPLGRSLYSIYTSQQWWMRPLTFFSVGSTDWCLRSQCLFLVVPGVRGMKCRTTVGIQGLVCLGLCSAICLCYLFNFEGPLVNPILEMKKLRCREGR